MTTVELEAEARDWAWIFFGVIPEDKLRECQRLAEINPNRNVSEMNFPIKRREILDAWYRLSSELTPVKIRECEFCRMYKYDSNEYSPCPFHHRVDVYYPSGKIEVKPLGSIFLEENLGESGPE